MASHMFQTGLAAGLGTNGLTHQSFGQPRKMGWQCPATSGGPVSPSSPTHPVTTSAFRQSHKSASNSPPELQNRSAIKLNEPQSNGRKNQGGRPSVAASAGIGGMLGGLFGGGNQAEKTRELYSGDVRKINELEPVAQKLTDEQLQGTTADLRRRVAAGESLDSVLPSCSPCGRELFSGGGSGNLTASGGRVRDPCGFPGVEPSCRQDVHGGHSSAAIADSPAWFGRRAVLMVLGIPPALLSVGTERRHGDWGETALTLSLAPPALADSGLDRALSKYVKKKKLDPIETYVPTVLLTVAQLEELRAVIADQGSDDSVINSARTLLRMGPAASFRTDIRAIALYADEEGAETAKRDAEACLEALSELDFKMRTEAGTGRREGMLATLAAVQGLIERVVGTVPQPVLERSKVIVAAVLSPAAVTSAETNADSGTVEEIAGDEQVTGGTSSGVLSIVKKKSEAEILESLF